MARVSKEEKEANFEKFNQIIMEIFFESGWESVTYDNIAKIAGVRKSTLQGYYPTKKDFGQTLKGKMLPIILKQLDFSSKAALVDSWKAGLSDKKFRYIVSLLLYTVTLATPPAHITSALNQLIDICESHFPNEGYGISERLLGLTIMWLATVNVEST
ncbi:TetR family transcriptional regulator [Shewanella sp. WXL01]|uniref:TetR family transcriptional regulator n=1 Tax=Shewanella sp. WXL01 TaxID=2709721 RepID=UPI00143855BC|nr:TetR family transcriptional regulator [Shewanella sp. WXL01]NKF50381.1 TetR family transcriptional regulator [Shewanella sp. WXL01]